jgi:hypothetical protein
VYLNVYIRKVGKRRGKNYMNRWVLPSNSRECGYAMKKGKEKKGI